MKTKYQQIIELKLKICRLIGEFFLKLWIKKVTGFENIPSNMAAILVSNHLSYFDFLLLGSLFRKKIVFLAVEKIKRIPFIKWFTKFHIVIFINREHPGVAFFREIIRYLESGRLLVVYPEAGRSRTGKMMKPKLGFVKLAMKTNTPVIPIAMKGTYDILPPHRRIPRLKRCEIIVGKKIYISPNNPEFEAIFFDCQEGKKFSNLTKAQLTELAIYIMDKVRQLAGQEWDDTIKEEAEEIIRKIRKNVSLITSF